MSDLKDEIKTILFRNLQDEDNRPYTISHITDEIMKEIRPLIEALEFYADSQNYSGGYYDTVSNSAEDKAREALEKLKDK